MAEKRPAQIAEETAGDLRFLHQSWPCRVRFGRGSLAEAPCEIGRLDPKSVLLIGTPGRAAVLDGLARALGDLVAGAVGDARSHVGQEQADAACRTALHTRADMLVAVGGGAATGLGKAVALSLGLPLACIPTTYSGSEMTPIWGITRNGEKLNGRDERVRPRLVIYDPDLFAGLPRATAAASAMNAMAHCVEALYAADASPLVAMSAEEGARALGEGLRRLAAGDEAADLLLYGAWLGGSALGAASMGLHHKLCHVLGGMLGLPHAEMHAILLPHVLAFNAPAAPAAMARLCRALALPDAAACARALASLAAAGGVPASLAEIGMREEHVAPAAAAVMASSYPNPRPIAAEAVRALLRDALCGGAPRVCGVCEAPQKFM
ncbi:maleylacetate reductase [Oleispirillum naphthae]|uniref:maleylacetate reductase n=1 Tax=Oleispirillum naphthae TaxID=2838853 RepID=UPI003082283F